MRRRGTALLTLIFGAGAIFALSRCLGPTEMVLEITTDVPCADFRGASVTVAGGPEIETSPPSATTTSCAPDGGVGSIVLIPSGGKRDGVRIKIVGAEKRDLESCATPPYGKGCIVARRRLSYIPHEPLHLRIALARACDDTPCDPDSTCVDGACRSAEVDPATCLGGGCGDPNGPPADAGPLDAGTDAAPADECGDTRGLAQTPWPAAGRCPTRIGRSAFRGAQTNGVRWIFPGDHSPMNVAPVLGADGTVYIGNNSGIVYAVFPDGGQRWQAPLGGNVNGSAGAVAADGTVYISAQNAGLYAIAPSGAASLALPSPASTFDYYRGAAAIAGDGTLFMGTLDGQIVSRAPTGAAQSLAVVVDAGKVGSPTIGPDGTVYAVAGSSVYAFTGRPLQQTWAHALGAPTSPTTPTDVMVGKDGFLYVGFGPSLVSIDPAPASVRERWRAPLPGDAVAASPLAPSQGPDGAVFLEDATGAITAVDPQTGTPRLFAKLPPGAFGLGLTIDRDGTVYGMASDNTFRAFAADGTPKWTVQLQENAYTAAAIGADGTVYIAVGGSGLYAIGP